MDSKKSKKWDPTLDGPIARNLKDSDAMINEILFDRYKFDYLNLDERILRGLARSGFNKLSFIQKEAIPLGRIGVDMVLQARSGSGKTCAFAVIALDSLTIGDSTQVLIVTPTREIAFQVFHVIRLIGIFYDNLKVALVTGGFKVGRDVEELQNAQFVIGTPGRLIQLIELGHLDTSSIRLLILDEADKLFDDQMSSQMEALITRLPEAKQTIAVSATFPDELKAKIDKNMKDPQIVSAGDDVLFPTRNAQFFSTVSEKPIYDSKIKLMKEWISNLTFNQMIIFVNTKESGQRISNDFTNSTDFSCTYMFGDLEQSERFEIYKRFHSQKFKILVTTDVFSRGVDFKNVNAIVNFDLPDNKETFLHRVGRAGRFGVDCLTLSLIASGPEGSLFEEFASQLGFEARLMPDDLIINNPWGVLDERFKTFELTDYQRIDRMVNAHRFRPPCRYFRPDPMLGINQDFVNPQPKRRLKPGREHLPFSRRPFRGMKLRGVYMRKFPIREWPKERDDALWHDIALAYTTPPFEYWSSSEEEGEEMPPGGWPGCCGGHITPGTNRWLSLDEDGNPIRHKFYAYPRDHPSLRDTPDRAPGKSRLVSSTTESSSSTVETTSPSEESLVDNQLPCFEFDSKSLENNESPKLVQN